MGVFNLLVFAVGLIVALVGALSPNPDVCVVGLLIFLSGLGIFVLRRVVKIILK